MIMTSIFKMTTVESSDTLFFRYTKIFPFINCFQSFEDTLMKIFNTRLKTGSVTANAGAVGLTFRGLATVSQMTWMIWKCTFISVKVFNLYI